MDWLREAHKEGTHADGSVKEPGTSKEELRNRGLVFFKECQDVVILQKVHRLDDGNDRMPPNVRELYRQSADRFSRRDPLSGGLRVEPF